MFLLELKRLPLSLLLVGATTIGAKITVLVGVEEVTPKFAVGGGDHQRGKITAPVARKRSLPYSLLAGVTTSSLVGHGQLEVWRNIAWRPESGVKWTRGCTVDLGGKPSKKRSKNENSG